MIIEFLREKRLHFRDIEKLILLKIFERKIFTYNLFFVRNFMLSFVTRLVPRIETL
jgi:hypothetical protein